MSMISAPFQPLHLLFHHHYNLPCVPIVRLLEDVESGRCAWHRVLSPHGKHDVTLRSGVSVSPTSPMITTGVNAGFKTVGPESVALMESWKGGFHAHVSSNLGGTFTFHVAAMPLDYICHHTHHGGVEHMQCVSPPVSASEGVRCFRENHPGYTS